MPPTYRQKSMFGLNPILAKEQNDLSIVDVPYLLMFADVCAKVLPLLTLSKTIKYYLNKKITKKNNC